jgi:uncharacterized membrane protein
LKPDDIDEPGRRQLWRLERLSDVVYALVIWRLFTLLPRPDNVEETALQSVAQLLAGGWEAFLFGPLALVIVIVYWAQSNELLGRLRRTDKIHTAICVFQLFFLLVFLYAIGLGIEIGPGADSRVFESGSAALVGAAAWLGWRYAMNRGDLLRKDITQQDAEQVLQRNVAEPLTALLTIPFSFIGPAAWELSWFLYPALRAILDRRRRSKAETSQGR